MSDREQAISSARTLRSAEGGVIWITGYSGAGKTTVGRKVENQLSRHGLLTVFLDGDDLRRILSGKWGFDRSDRMELAKVYFRLCSHLASQHVTVVISAIAMYADVYDWMRVNIARAMQVYLRVPEDERIRRDRESKNVYQSIQASQLGYDEPTGADVVIDNYGDMNADRTANQIVDLYIGGSFRQLARVADHGKGQYWDTVYRQTTGVQDPSAFALYVGRTLQKGKMQLLDVGCGNGRDAAYFSRLGHDVWAIDASRSAIDLCRQLHPHSPTKFQHGTAETLAAERTAPGFDIVYCRFVLHAMTMKEEAAFCLAGYGLLKEHGRLAIECRSVNDPMIRLGEVLSPTERIFGHYRRFVVMDELLERLKSIGFTIEERTESNGLAVFKDEDPVVNRIIARR